MVLVRLYIHLPVSGRGYKIIGLVPSGNTLVVFFCSYGGEEIYVKKFLGQGLIFLVILSCS